MKTLTTILVCLIFANSGFSYSKYGRTCKDIGCTSSETCVMAEDPCSYYNRGNDCGQYPTCQKVNSGAPSCATYVCPPTKRCTMDGSTPKCIDDKNSKTEFSSIQEKNSAPTHNQNPSAPSAPSLYPNLRPGQTTPRSPIHRPAPGGGGNGYGGGSIGSGYPGQPSNNNNNAGGRYPGSGGGYAGGGYPGGGYPSGGGYPGGGGYYGGGYPGNGYPAQPPRGGGGYNYPNNGGYGYRPQQKPPSSGSDSILDRIGDGLKNWGTNLLKDALTKQIG